MNNFKDPKMRPYASSRFLLNYSNKGWGIDSTDGVTEECAELYLRIALTLVRILFSVKGEVQNN
jgi:hypothetical protein